MRAYLTLSIVLLCCWQGLYAASSSLQTESKGTVIFFEWLHDRFVLATDSIETHAHPPPTFDDCKIIAQGTANKFFTVSGGVRSATIMFVDQGKPGKVEWDTQKTATKAYKTVTSPKDPKKVAEEWKRLTMQQLDSLPIHLRVSVRPLQSNQMLFVGLLADGSIDAQVATFSFDGKRFDITIVRPPMNRFRSIAEGERAAYEFMQHKSPEVNREFSEWKASLNATFGVRTQEEFDTQLVMKVAEYAIKHPGHDIVGGQVEAVKLQPNSTIIWLSPCPNAKKAPTNHR
jgi:hypothetical protein